MRSESGTDRTKVGSVGTHDSVVYGLFYLLRGDYDSIVVTDSRLGCARFWGNLDYVVRMNGDKYEL